VGRSRKGTDSYGGLLWDDSLSRAEPDLSKSAARARLTLQKLNENLSRFPRYVPVEHIVVSHCPQWNQGGSGGMAMMPKYVSVTGNCTEWSTQGGGAAAYGTGFPESNHTINALNNGMVWRVDVSMSRAFAIDFVRDRETARQTQTRGFSETDRVNYITSTRPAVLLIDNDEGVETVRVRQYNRTLEGVDDYS
jgi:hypothetical protein